jgi:hypothetical protein
MQRRALWLIIGILGCGAFVALTCGGGLLTLALALTGEATLTAAETLPLAGLIALGLILGVPLVLQGWAGWRERPSRPFNPSRAWWLWPALVLLVALGAVVSLLPLAPALLLPPIHVLTMILLPLFVLTLVGRALRGTGGSWREVVAGVAGGGLLSIGVSLIGEALIVLVAIIALTIIAMMTPGGPEKVAALANEMRDPAWQADITNMLNLLLSPAVAISVLGVLSIPVPLVEEAFKTLTGGMVARWIRPHPARAFLWGVAGGAGFALVENLFSGALGGVESWAAGAIARFGTTAMHCITGGLIGWAWGQLWTARRPLRLLGAYAAAVAIHGLWNAAAAGALLLGAAAVIHEANELLIVLAGLGISAFLGMLGLLTVAFVVGLYLAGRRLAAQAEPPQGEAGRPEEAPLSSEAPVA